MLVVDDAKTMRTIIHEMLVSLGHRDITEAENGEEALALVRRKPFAIIISDWNMAPMNGLELLKNVRKISRPGTNRFIFSTSERAWGHRTSAKIEGAEGFLTKPFTVDELGEKIATALGRA